ncbi:MAG: protein kinase domain-containing protein [Archangium sp.]
MAHKLGRYTLEKRIGSGGMADVWLADGPHGRCVLKVPHRHLCDNAEFVRMFLDEASLLAQLHHPNIAQIYDLGQADGAYYLAMEFVSGFDLMTISLEHERHGELMSPELCARIVADAAGALHYAHEAKDLKGNPLHIIHRDVTPHNILLSRRGVVKLIDFGVAKAASTMHRTQAGFVKGKYPYMSPEQITGQIIDRRVDVYALGLVLYELLTNVRAIPGNNEIEQIDAARSGKVRPIEQLRPNVPVPIRQILGACLHFEVEGRYPTALALKEDLEKFLTLERQVLGQDDLLRLFRVVAADVGQAPPELDARPTDVEQPKPEEGPVVLPSQPDAKIDELGYSSTQPSLKMPAFTPGAQPQPLALTASKVVPAVNPVEAAQTRQIQKPTPSKMPLIVLGGLSLVIIGLVLALWEPWAVAEQPAVDAGVAVVTPPPEPEKKPDVIDAGVAVVEDVPDAAVEVAVAEPIDAGVVRTNLEIRAVVVSVTSVIEADVLVDGKKYGRTPTELELMPGKHRIAVINKAQGVERIVNWVLKPGERKTLNVAPAAKGVLRVEVTGFCALSVDGRPFGNPSSLFEVKDLSEGSHAVVCTLEDPSLLKPRVKKQTVKITGGQQTELRFNMLTD